MNSIDLDNMNFENNIEVLPPIVRKEEDLVMKEMY